MTPGLTGVPMLLVQPLDKELRPKGKVLVAADATRTRMAGSGERVLVLDEGNGARQVLDSKDGPVRSVVVGIVDAVETSSR